MILIKNGELFSPEPLGRCDLLVSGNSIVHRAEDINPDSLPGQVEVIDAAHGVVTPGFIDGHQHFTGGGGEGGFHTRTPEMVVSMNLFHGVTTAVGLLGTDSLTRSVESLYAKTEAFNHEGITALMLTGSYWHPSPTITGSIGRDLTYLGPVIGLKLALSDTRGPFVQTEDLAAMASEVRVAALVAGKPGIITLHVGVREERLTMVFEVVENYGIRADMFVPTHINRKDDLLKEQVFKLAEMGTMLDATCLNYVPEEGDSHQSAADFACEADGVGLFDRVSFSSDAGGSMPTWDKDRKHILGMGIGSPRSMLFELNRLVNEKHMPLGKALCPLTTTPAQCYGLNNVKGQLRVGADADILVLNPENMQVMDVVAKGRIVKRNNILEKKGYFE